MKIKTRNHTVHTLDIDGDEVELEFEPSYDGHVLAERVGDTLVVGYLSYDHDYRSVDDHMGDGMGKMYSFHRNASKSDHRDGLEALGNTSDGEKDLEAVWNKHEDEAVRRYVACVMHDYKPDEIIEQFGEDPADESEAADIASNLLISDANGVSYWDRVEYGTVMGDVLEKMWEESAYFPGDRDAQLLACYSHGGESWSLSGGGMQCRWDTNNSAGVWVPDDCLRKELDHMAPAAAWAFIENTNWARGTGKKYQLKIVSWNEAGPVHIGIEPAGFSDDYCELVKQRDAIAAKMPAPTAKHLAWGRDMQARIFAKQFLETYNDIINGNVYNVTLQLFDWDGDVWISRGDWDGSGGYVGDEHAMESLREEFFNPAIAKLKEEHPEKA